MPTIYFQTTNDQSDPSRYVLKHTTKIAPILADNLFRKKLYETPKKDIPASKIAALRSGEIVAQIDREADQKSGLSTYHCKIDIPTRITTQEQEHCQDLPKYYDFGTMEEKEAILRNNMKRIIREISEVVSSYS